MQNKETERLVKLVAGIVLAIAGVAVMLMNITVVNFRFYRIGPVDTAAILLIILGVLLIWAFMANRPRVPVMLIILDLLLIIISVIMGTRFRFKQIDALTIILIIGLIASGIGLFLSGMIGPLRGGRKNEPDVRQVGSKTEKLLQEEMKKEELHKQELHKEELNKEEQL